MSRTNDELFDFISDSETKERLASDLKELHECMENELWKAAVVLIGAMIEALLYHYISQVPSIRDSIERYEHRNIGLNYLLQWSREHDIIDENLFRLSEPIRDYRNLIHPRVQERLEVEPNQNLAEIGYNVFLEIARSANDHHSTTKSKRAESLVEKTVKEIDKRKAEKSDIQVYKPIIEKYGRERGRLIIERSTKQSRC